MVDGCSQDYICGEDRKMLDLVQSYIYVGFPSPPYILVQVQSHIYVGYSTPYLCWFKYNPLYMLAILVPYKYWILYHPYFCWVPKPLVNWESAFLMEVMPNICPISPISPISPYLQENFQQYRRQGYVQLSCTLLLLFSTRESPESAVAPPRLSAERKL